jgi:hypothetical protein
MYSEGNLGEERLDIQGSTRVPNGISCGSQVITFCQNTADFLGNGCRTVAIIIDFSKAFDLFLHNRLLRNIAASEVDQRLVVWIREFLLERTQGVRVGGQLLEDVTVTPGLAQGCSVGPLFCHSLRK